MAIKIPFLQRFFFKKLAKQLRKPQGKFGGQVALKMNASNAALYNFVIKTMDLQAGQRLLEIGFGNGKTFSDVFTAADHLNITGIDYSAEMVKLAGEMNAGYIEEGRLRLVCGNSDAMPFEDDSFDAVYCLNVVYFWDQPAAHLKEVARVLKPGGQFYPALRTKKSMELLPFTKHGFAMYEENEWKNIMELNGFVVESVAYDEEPPAELNGNYFEIASHCFVARNNK